MYILLISKFRSERGNLNWCRFWASYVCTFFDASVVHICHQLFTFIQIGSGHTVLHMFKYFARPFFILCTFIIHETFWLKRENIFSHPFHILILRPYFIRSRFLNFFPTLLKSSIVYVWFQMVRHFYHIIWNLRIGWSLPRTTDTQRELFFKNSKLLGLGRQIGLKFWGAFWLFPAKLLALFWHCESLVHGKV